jgi:exosortase/archaeosortase
MSELLRQVLIAVAFGALCFGCGYLAAFVVTRFLGNVRLLRLRLLRERHW